jgi:acetylornithine deacetylase/succinyl-diaminopimelate desuccinylase-like protein
MDGKRLKSFIGRSWDEEIVPALTDYIRIPNKSPHFDPSWREHGHMEQAVKLLAGWAQTRLGAIDGAHLEIVRLEGRTPVILIEIPGAGGAERVAPVLLYGHFDKQPEMTGWSEGLGPWSPQLRGDRLYGRGGADDGYAMFGALSAIFGLRDQHIAHAPCCILIEACEESGSYDLPAYVDYLAPRLGQPALVVCLDSGCGDYDRLWLTTSLRGIAMGNLTVRVLSEGVHSGDASGIVPSSFRILRSLLERIEEADTGRIKLDALYCQIPEERRAQAREAASALGASVFSKFPFLPGMTAMGEDLAELVLNRTWRPALSTVGLAGAPEPQNAGNVLRPFTTAKLSMRLPPTVDAAAATAALKRALERDPPYGAEVEFAEEPGQGGWNAPPLAPWLAHSIAQASEAAFGQAAAMMGEGGSIPFMGMLGAKFPQTQFVITGVLGPHSNAHGPNEFLHIPTGKNVTEVIARILADYAAQSR